jgi:superfamily II DNA or RNA helicase
VTEIKLRDYQEEAIDAVFAAWAGGMRRPAIVLPTGAGKTVVFSSLVQQWGGWYWGNDAPEGLNGAHRVIVLAHRDELVDQAIGKLRALLPADTSVGKVKADDNDIDTDVMVCSVQTLASARRRGVLAAHQDKHGPIGLIITDECHHAAAASYQKVYDAFPDALHLGVTATMARGDGVGLGSVWEDVVFKRSVLWMMKRGYLTDVEARRVSVDIDMSGVKTSRGDYQAGDLGQALMQSEAHRPIAQAYVDHAKDRRGIVFTPTVETAHATAEELNTAGVKTAVVSGETPRDERRRIFDDFRTGKVQVLSNCMVLTEGFDAPWAEVAVIARPTQSQPLYVQMVGRVLRPWPGKERALVLDVVGASASNKLRTLIDLEPGRVQEVQEGETLQEAEEREEEEADAIVPRPAGSPSFQLKVKDVGLFAGSDHAWVTTPKGVLYINCGERYVFLWPSPKEPGTWDVCHAATKGREPWQRTEYQGLELGAAMAWGEAVSEDFYAGFSTRRSASWRKGKPSDAQLEFAQRLGIPGAESMGKGDLSTAIDIVMGARFFDPRVSG